MSPYIEHHRGDQRLHTVVWRQLVKSVVSKELLPKSTIIKKTMIILTGKKGTPFFQIIYFFALKGKVGLLFACFIYNYI